MKMKILVMAILGLFLSGSVYAAEFIKPSAETGTVTVSASETHHNLYTAGSNVIINGRVTGDLYAAGGMVNVVGEVEDDLSIAGGNLNISGKVGGNLRMAGGNISLTNTVAEDLLAAGGNIYISENASVTGDFIVAGGNVDLQSPVGGAAKITGGTVTINNVITGELFVTAQEHLTFGPKSRVLGKITYYGNSDPIIQDGAQVGTIDRHALPKRGTFSKGLIGFGVIVSLLAFIAAALLLMYLLKRELTTATDMIKQEPWANLGIGLISLILGPVVFVLLLVSMIGYYIAFLILFWYILALMLSCLVAAVFLGRWIMGYLDKNSYTIDWRVVVLGVVAYKIMSMVPFIGWLAAFLLSVTAFGAILRMAKYQLRRQ